MKLVKFVSNSGITSRRTAKDWILAGRVKVNGGTNLDPAFLLCTDDRVEVDGITVRHQEPRLWLYHKPAGLITTHRDPQNRKTVFEELGLGHVISVGRLDLNTSGLLLITNVGSVARHFELPKNGYERAYMVRAFGCGDLCSLEAASRNGICVDGVKYAPFALEVLACTGQNARFYVKLCEGKNREIRRIFGHFGMQVNKLKRIQYGPYFLDDLALGSLKEVELCFDNIKEK